MLKSDVFINLIPVESVDMSTDTISKWRYSPNQDHQEILSSPEKRFQLKEKNIFEKDLSLLDKDNFFLPIEVQESSLSKQNWFKNSPQKKIFTKNDIKDSSQNEFEKDVFISSQHESSIEKAALSVVNEIPLQSIENFQCKQLLQNVEQDNMCEIIGRRFTRHLLKKHELLVNDSKVQSTENKIDLRNQKKNVTKIQLKNTYRTVTEFIRKKTIKTKIKKEKMPSDVHKRQILKRSVKKDSENLKTSRKKRKGTCKKRRKLNNSAENLELLKPGPVTKKVRKKMINYNDHMFHEPFKQGWRREVVYRSPYTMKSRADVYYHSPEGEKLRSFVEIKKKLSDNGLTVANFTFFKGPLGINDSMKEIIRYSRRIKNHYRLATSTATQENGVEFYNSIKNKSFKMKIRSLSHLSKKKCLSTSDKVLKAKVAATENSKINSRKSDCSPILVLHKLPLNIADDIAQKVVSASDVLQNIQTNSNVTNVFCEKNDSIIDHLLSEKNSSHCYNDSAILIPQDQNFTIESNTECSNKNTSLENECFTYNNNQDFTDAVNETSKTGNLISSKIVEKINLKPELSNVKENFHLKNNNFNAHNINITLESSTKRISLSDKMNADDIIIHVNDKVCNLSKSVQKTNKACQLQLLRKNKIFQKKFNRQFAYKTRSSFCIDSKYSNTVKSSICNESTGIETMSGKSYKYDSIAQNKKQLNLKKSVKRSKITIQKATHYHSLVSFCAGYSALKIIFSYLNVEDLLIAEKVCKVWKDLVNDSILWTKIKINNSQLTDVLANILYKHKTSHLLIKSDNDNWKNVVNVISQIKTLHILELDSFPAIVFEEIFQKCPQLEIVKAVLIQNQNFDIHYITNLRNLRKFHLISTTTISLYNFTPIYGLSQLTHLSLCSVANFTNTCIQNIAHIVNLENLELGECTGIDRLGLNALFKLKNLKRLRLEKLRETNCNDVLKIVSQLKNLIDLELVHIGISYGFDDYLSKCQNIIKLLLVPNCKYPSAFVNDIILKGTTKLSNTLKQFTWHFTQQSLQLSNTLFKESEDDYIPFMKSYSYYQGFEKIFESEEHALKREKLENIVNALASAVGIEAKHILNLERLYILSLSNLKKLYTFLLPKTDIYIQKIY